MRAAKAPDEVGSGNNPPNFPTMHDEDGGVAGKDVGQKVRWKVVFYLGVGVLLYVPDPGATSPGLGDRAEERGLRNRAGDPAVFQHRELREPATFHDLRGFGDERFGVYRRDVRVQYVACAERRDGVGLQLVEMGEYPLDEFIRRPDLASLNPGDRRVAPTDCAGQLAE